VAHDGGEAANRERDGDAVDGDRLAHDERQRNDDTDKEDQAKRLGNGGPSYGENDMQSCDGAWKNGNEHQ
jgi:hypothetical protein